MDFPASHVWQAVHQGPELHGRCSMEFLGLTQEHKPRIFSTHNLQLNILMGATLLHPEAGVRFLQKPHFLPVKSSLIHISICNLYIYVHICICIYIYLRTIPGPWQCVWVKWQFVLATFLFVRVFAIFPMSWVRNSTESKTYQNWGENQRGPYFGQILCRAAVNAWRSRQSLDPWLNPTMGEILWEQTIGPIGDGANHQDGTCT